MILENIKRTETWKGSKKIPVDFPFLVKRDRVNKRYRLERSYKMPLELYTLVIPDTAKLATCAACVKEVSSHVTSH